MALAAACLSPHDSATCLRLTFLPMQAHRAVLRVKSRGLVFALERWRDHAAGAKALNAKVCQVFLSPTEDRHSHVLLQGDS